MKGKSNIKKVAQAAIIAALCYVTFTFIQIKIPTAGGMTSLHIANTFLVLGALYLGGVYGGFAGAVGMSIADIMDPIYIIEAPLTFILKLCIGLVVGFVAHKIAKIDESSDKKYIFKWSLLASIAGFAFNVIFNPVMGFFYRKFILGQPQDAAAIIAGWSTVSTFINAVVSTILVVLIYNATRPTLKKTGMI